MAATPGDEQLAVDVCRAAASASLFSTLRVGNARAVALPDPTSSASGDWDSRLLEELRQHVVAQQLRRLPSYRSSDGKRVVDSEAGDVLVHRQRQQRYRMLAVQRFNDWNGPWFASVRECLEAC